MDHNQEFRQQLAARLRQVARDLLDHVAIANNQEQKRQLVQRALAMIQITEELLSFAGANECLPIADGANAKRVPATEAEQVAEPHDGGLVPALPQWSWNATLVEGTSYRPSAPRGLQISQDRIARLAAAGGTLKYRQYSIWALSARGAMALPMSDFELRLVRALDRCELKPRSTDQRFCDDLSTMSRHQSQILLSEDQRAYLWRIAYRYRHRLVEDLSEEAERRAGILKQQDGNPKKRRDRAKYRGGK